MRRDKPPPWTLRLLLAENYYTASASGPSDTLKNPETLCLPTASRGKPVCKGPSVKPTEVQKPIHNVKDQTRRHDATGKRKIREVRPATHLNAGGGDQDRTPGLRPKERYSPVRFTRRALLVITCHLNAGGGDRDRTGDLLLAKQMLSQLSYAPEYGGPG